MPRRHRPAFAEGWCKRVTIYFLPDENEKSPQDSAEVFTRNPRHLGALSGAGQIHLQQGKLRRALELFRQALDVNSFLEDAALTIAVIEQRLRSGEPGATLGCACEAPPRAGRPRQLGHSPGMARQWLVANRSTVA